MPCNELAEWLRGELDHIASSPGDVRGKVEAVARLALEASRRLREAGVECSLTGEAVLDNHPVLPLSFTLAPIASSGEARICAAYVLDLGGVAGLVEKLGGGADALEKLRGLFAGLAEALGVFERMGGEEGVELRIEEGGRRVVLRRCEDARGEPEEVADRLWRWVERVAEKLGWRPGP